MGLKLEVPAYFRRVFGKTQKAVLPICALFLAPTALLSLHYLDNGIGHYLSALFTAIVAGVLATTLIAGFISVFDS